MSKIKIYHFLNESLKPKFLANKVVYPLYVEVGYKRKATKFKSLINRYVDVKLKSILNNSPLIQLEKSNIEKCIKRNESTKNFKLK